MQNQQPLEASHLEGGRTLKFTACTLYLETVKEGWKTHISLFSRTGRQKGCWSDLTWARPSNCSRRPVFTLNQTLPPRPLAARPGSINMGLILFLYSLLQLDRWSMKAGTWECSSEQWLCWEMWNSAHISAIISLSWWVAMAPANPAKDYSPRVNLLIFHSYQLGLVLLNCA